LHSATADLGFNIAAWFGGLTWPRTLIRVLGVRQSMDGFGTATFTDPEDFRVSVPGARINLVLTSRYDFRARLTWVNGPRMRLARCTESAPRVAFVALGPGPVFVSFPIRHAPPPVWSGVEMRPGEIVLHGCGDHIHQRTSGASRWGLISLAPKDLDEFSQALMHAVVPRPTAAKILKPPSKVVADLMRLHAQACRLAETKPDLIAHREVLRALEHDLFHAVVNCLTADAAPCHEPEARQRHAKIMARFEEVVGSPVGAPRSVPEIAAAVGVLEQTLRRCCKKFLGMSPSRYARLRQLTLVRAALRKADPATASVGAIAGQYGITELGRFAVSYRMIFGEKPSTTLESFYARG
jgi:methylphosphotriester-DNA--protein-cysteine methyltransferase